jgi:hypothetical protein
MEELLYAVMADRDVHGEVEIRRVLNEGNVD